MPETLVERHKLVTAIPITTTNGALTGDYVKCSQGTRILVVVNLNQAATHQTAITIEQATTAAAAGTKAIAKVVPIWQNDDTDTTDTLVRETTDAVSLTVGAGATPKQVVFQIDPSLLDVANDFDWITVKTAASSEATNFASAIYIVQDVKYGGDPPPTQIV